MDKEYVQHLRYKLQKRVRNLNTEGFATFHTALQRFWGFLRKQPSLWGILEDLEKRCPEAQQSAESIVGGQALAFGDELQHVAVAYFVLRKCAESDRQDIEFDIGHNYTTASKHDEALDSFRLMFLDPAYEYLDEQLDDQRAMLALLRKYKQKCEWFQREPLYKLWSDDTSRGERRLAQNLYEYLHDQGLEFSIEPTSASGEADLVSAQTSDDRLIADAKMFHPGRDKGKGYLIRAFQQIYRYTVDYTQPFGYLIIFKTCEEDIKLALTNSEQFTPSVTYNNKTIFFLVIDIFRYEQPASKRPGLKAIEITEADLVADIAES